jgi:hypothetical protein
MAPKRQKVTHGTAAAASTALARVPGKEVATDDVSIISAEVFAASTVAAARRAYAVATPYTHGVVAPLCSDARLRAVQLEMRENLTATFKETDLFKVLQTGDLVTIDQVDPTIAPKIPELLRLRAAIYSPRFRAMVQEMTGCAPLTDRVDCSANVYPRSGHLLCHDDVIGTRCISYIIYLTARPTWLHAAAWTASARARIPVGACNTDTYVLLRVTLVDFYFESRSPSSSFPSQSHDRAASKRATTMQQGREPRLLIPSPVTSPHVS